MRAALTLSFALVLTTTACKSEDGAGSKAAAAKTTDATATDATATDATAAKAKPEATAASHPAAAAATKTALGNGETPALRDQMDKDGVVRRGTELPKAKTVSVADCVLQAEKLAGQEVLISGRVAQVCANKGCWWAIENPENPSQTIRVTHKDYGFFVPKGAKGRDALAFGKLEVKKLTKEEALHLAKDEGLTDIDETKLPTVELRLEATSLEMRSAT